MLSKLLKHEFTATSRVMWIIYAAMMALSFGANISLRGLDSPASDNRVLGALMILILVMWVLSLVIGMAATVVLVVKRFHDNLLTDEGYLMFTLPGSVHQLVLSKIIVASVWLVASMAVIGLCVCVAVMSTAFLREISEVLRGIYREMTAYYAINGTTAVLELLLVLFLGCAAATLQFYSAMAIGHGFTNHKVLWSVVFYFVQSAVIEILGTILLSGFVGSDAWQEFDLFSVSGVQLWHMSMLGTCVIELAEAVVFYFLTTVNLQKRLNLS